MPNTNQEITLQQAKDMVAKKYGYCGDEDTWDSFRHQYVMNCVPERFHDEAAELYAQSQVKKEGWNEAINAALKLAETASSLTFTTELQKLRK